MGNKHSSNDIDGKITQQILEAKMKDIDILTLQINVYQLVILEELQNGKILENIADNYEYKYNNFMEMMSKNLNETMNNNTYVKFEGHVKLINIVFDYETKKVNVITPTNFNLKNIYLTSLNKLDEIDKESFSDINNLNFQHNTKDISNNFINNYRLDGLNISDKEVIVVLRKNNMSRNNSRNNSINNLSIFALDD